MTFDREKALYLAHCAIIAEMGDARDTAVKALQRIGDECGPDAVDLAMRVWIDTLAHRTGHPIGQPVKLEFLNVEDGVPDVETTTADAVTRPEVVWAARLSAARIALDHDTYRALINALPDDPATVGRHVFAVLEGCALTMSRFGVTP